MPHNTGTTDAFGAITTVLSESTDTIHLFAEEYFGPQPSLPDTLTPPDGNWVLSAPFTNETVIITTEIDESMPELRTAFETLGYTVVPFTSSELVGVMLSHIDTECYHTTNDLITTYYNWDRRQGEYTAPELCFESFNEQHVHGTRELTDAAARRLHTWITDHHPDYDWFTPTTPDTTYPLTSLTN